MKSTLKAFGATLDQVCAGARDRFGTQCVSDDAQAISTSLAMAEASQRTSMPIMKSMGVLAFTTAVAVSSAIVQTPVEAQTMVLQNSAKQSTLAAHAPAVDPLTAGRTENGVARVAGGIGGALLGGALTQGSGGLVKTAAVLGLGYLGQAMGDMLTRKVTDQNGHEVYQDGVDREGKPIYRPILSAEEASKAQSNVQVLQPGTQANPIQLSKEVYENAISRASAFSTSPFPGQTPSTLRELDQQTHVSLYSMMVNTVAIRAIAKSSYFDLDRTELARAVSPNNPEKAAEFSAANKAYAQSFTAYSMAYRQTAQALAIADKTGFDVSAQKTLMAVVPGDLRREPGAPISWPGVDDRIRELAASSNLDQTASFAEISAQSQKTTARERPRQRQ